MKHSEEDLMSQMDSEPITPMFAETPPAIKARKIPITVVRASDSPPGSPETDGKKSTVMMEGYLMKRSIGGGYMCGWNKRYIVLSVKKKCAEIAYFVDGNSQQAKGILWLNQHSKVVSSEVDHKPFCFEVRCTNGVVLYLHGHNQKEIDSWTAKITEAINEMKETRKMKHKMSAHTMTGSRLGLRVPKKMEGGFVAQEHIYSFGVNLHGQLGNGTHEEKGSNTTSSSSSSNLVKLNMERESVSAMGVGSRHCGVALSSGKLFMWGDATHGQLAGISQTDSTAQSRKAMKEGTKVEIIFGKRKGCEGILIREVKPKRWLVSIKNTAKNKTEKVEYPENKFRSTIAPSPPPLFPSMMITLPQQVKLPIKVLDLACGDTHTIAVLEDRTVFSWGSGNYGQLGLGDNIKRVLTPQHVSGMEKPVMSVYCGPEHSMVLDMDGKLHAFGKASQGRLGLGNARRNQWTPALVNLRLSRMSLAHSDEAGGPQVKPKSMTNRKSIMRNRGRRGTSNDSLNSGTRQSGMRQMASEVGDVACGVACTVIVSFDEVWQTGTLRTQASSTSFCQIEELRGADFKRVACGSMHAMALSNSGHVYSWGQGSMLGHGDEVERPFPELVIGLVGHRITAISCSDFSSVAVSDDGVVFVWGQWWCSSRAKKSDVRMLKVPTPIHVEDGILAKRGSSSKNDECDDDGSHDDEKSSKEEKEEEDTPKVMNSLADLDLDNATVRFPDMVECGGSTILIRTRQQQRV